ncbi:MAG: TetR/AcrR family transcriptional regulator [Burkholderiaceae bacterium]
MARPSQGIDQALLRSGLALLPELGCTGLSVRRVADHARVNPAMFHYHFGSKAAFLRAVLQQLYEQMFAGLSAGAAGQGPAVDRLHAALFSLAGFVRAQRPVIGRLAVDAANGEAVVHEFVRANAPRHLGLLLALAQEAEQAGELQPMAPVQRFAFLMGSIVAPLLVVPAVAAVQALPPALAATAIDQVLSDDALHQRISMALRALGPTAVAERSSKGPAKRRPTPR